MNRTKFSFVTLRLMVIGILLTVAQNPTSACSRIYPFSFDELFVADVIVRATAMKYAIRPEPKARTTGESDSMVAFKVEEVLKGKDVPNTIALNGHLSDIDDYNDVDVPYNSVRSEGRHGNCFASSYKEGAQFLLFLKKTKDGYTSHISPLGPTNEQLHGIDDDWLRWVKDYLKVKKADVSSLHQSRLSQDSSAKQSDSDMSKLEGFTTRRITFTGNSHTRDQVLRDAVKLKEGDIFVIKQLQESMKRLSKLGLFEKVTEQDVTWEVIESTREVDLDFRVKEKRRGNK